MYFFLPEHERETSSGSVTDGSSTFGVKVSDGPDGGAAELLRHLVLVLARVSSVMELLTQAAQKSLTEEERQVGRLTTAKSTRPVHSRVVIPERVCRSASSTAVDDAVKRCFFYL